MSKLTRKRNPEVLRQILAAYGSRVTLAYSEPVNTPRVNAVPVNGCTLKNLRAKRGWSQLKLQSWSGVAQAVICRVERGETNYLAYSKARQLAEALGVSMEALAE